jgi:hypothetical protein
LVTHSGAADADDEDELLPDEDDPLSLLLADDDALLTDDELLSLLLADDDESLEDELLPDEDELLLDEDELLLDALQQQFVPTPR